MVIVSDSTTAPLNELNSFRIASSPANRLLARIVDVTIRAEQMGDRAAVLVLDEARLSPNHLSHRNPAAVRRRGFDGSDYCERKQYAFTSL